jgi:long-chain acyl-CoA synthetase
MIFLLAPPEIAHILEDSEAVVMITSPEFYPNIVQACATLQRPPKIVVVGEPAPEGALSFEQLLADANEAHPIVERSSDDLAVISYTSGTTGRPKGVMLSHGNMEFQARNTSTALDIHDGDRAVGCLPLAHLFGLGSTLSANMHQTTGVLLRWFTAEGFFDAVQRLKARSSGVVPTMLTFMLSHPEFDNVDWSSLRWVICGAAPLPVELGEEFEKRTGARVLQGYGLTETSPGASLMLMSDPPKPGSCGRPLPNVDIKAVDDAGNEVPAGEPGEVWIKGPNIMKGYYRMPEATDAVMKDGWFASGDIGHFDEDGFLYITERKKDLIIRGGFNIFPRDIEELLYEHPGVLEAAVVGIPDPKFGEEVIAYVTPKAQPPVTEDELLAFCRERLAKYKTPKHVKFLPALPKNAIGKILKKDLREMAKADPMIAGATTPR